MSILPLGMSEAARIWTQIAHIAFESQMVIGMRLAGMMGFLPQKSSEPQRMVQEKLDAAQESGLAMFKAASRGASPDKVMAAGLKPYSKRTRANAKRLTKSSTARRR
ncbi:hypothetical protein SAMN05421538_104249 [Paracoccus isoporae]|uniref:Antifreeze protein n=1 Tax=Paracoccus isoporae TaxID=591205 RepID=A0A1G7AU23_9RHOB|nr:hypothetical protein [Paracoccus isoporae]SDE18222.1 hypothetical protein SAMN05421538_104249 [Paracoccus isoporae]